jgi:hypothetical protein
VLAPWRDQCSWTSRLTSARVDKRRCGRPAPPSCWLPGSLPQRLGRFTLWHAGTRTLNREMYGRTTGHQRFGDGSVVPRVGAESSRDLEYCFRIVRDAFCDLGCNRDPDQGSTRRSGTLCGCAVAPAQRRLLRSTTGFLRSGDNRSAERRLHVHVQGTSVLHPGHTGTKRDVNLPHLRANCPDLITDSERNGRVLTP